MLIPQSEVDVESVEIKRQSLFRKKKTFFHGIIEKYFILRENIYFINTSTLQKMVSQVKQVLLLLTCLFISPTLQAQSWTVLQKEAQQLYEASNYDKSIQVGLQALQQAESDKSNEKKLSFGRTLTYLGLAYQVTGDLEAALKYHQRGTDIALKHYGKTHYLYGSRLINVGIVSKFLEQPEKAQQALETALPVVEKHWGTSNDIYKNGLLHCAEVCYDNKKLDLAERYYMKSYRLYQAKKTAVPLVVSIGLSKVKRDQKDFNGAAQYLESALNTLKKMPNRNPKDVKSITTDLSYFYKNQNNHGGLLKLYEFCAAENIKDTDKMLEDFLYNAVQDMTYQEEEEAMDKAWRAYAKILQSRTEEEQDEAKLSSILSAVAQKYDSNKASKVLDLLDISAKSTLYLERLKLLGDIFYKEKKYAASIEKYDQIIDELYKVEEQPHYYYGYPTKVIYQLRLQKALRKNEQLEASFEQLMTVIKEALSGESNFNYQVLDNKSASLFNEFGFWNEEAPLQVVAAAYLKTDIPEHLVIYTDLGYYLFKYHLHEAAFDLVEQIAVVTDIQANAQGEILVNLENVAKKKGVSPETATANKIKILRHYAGIFNRLGEVEKALYLYQVLYEDFEQEPKDEAFLLSNLVELYRELSLIEEANQYYQILIKKGHEFNQNRASYTITNDTELEMLRKKGTNERLVSFLNEKIQIIKKRLEDTKKGLKEQKQIQSELNNINYALILLNQELGQTESRTAVNDIQAFQKELQPHRNHLLAQKQKVPNLIVPNPHYSKRLVILKLYQSYLKETAGDLATAMTLKQEALTILQKDLTYLHRLTKFVLKDAADLAEKMGQYTQAIDFLKAIFDIEIKGHDSLYSKTAIKNTLALRYRLAHLYAQANQENELFDYQEIVNHMLDYYSLLKSEQISDFEKELLQKEVKQYRDYNHMLAIKYPNKKGLKGDNLNDLLFFDKLLALDKSELRRELYDRHFYGYADIYKDLVEKRNSLPFEYLDAKRSKKNMDSLLQIFQQEELKMMNYTPELWKLYAYPTWQNLKKQLSNNEVVVRFFEVEGQNEVPMYGSYILDKNSTQPVLVKLKPAVSEALKLVSNDSTEENKATISSLIGSSLKTHLQGKQKIYYSTEGNLNKFDFSKITTQDNQTYEWKPLSDLFL